MHGSLLKSLVVINFVSWHTGDLHNYRIMKIFSQHLHVVWRKNTVSLICCLVNYVWYGQGSIEIIYWVAFSFSYLTIMYFYPTENNLDVLWKWYRKIQQDIILKSEATPIPPLPPPPQKKYCTERQCSKNDSIDHNAFSNLVRYLCSQYRVAQKECNNFDS